MVFLLAGFTGLLIAMLACARTPQSSSSSFWSVSHQGMLPAATAVTVESTTQAWGLPTRRAPNAPILTPTPDAQHTLPALRTKQDQYAVQYGDTLALIANRYGISVEQLTHVNKLTNADILEVGQVLTIPVPTPEGMGPDFKIIPDSELVNGPVNILFDMEKFVNDQGGYLASYNEQVNEQTLTGAQIVRLIAQDYSVSPRLLLAVLQHQSGWVAGPKPKKQVLDYPIGLLDPTRKGLYRQLAWAANNLNRGFYLWRINGIATWLLADGSIVPIAPTINAGTAGVQQLYATLYDRSSWEKAVSPEGFYATYNALFGFPFDYAIEPSLPPNLTQPPLQLPFEQGAVWSFTGGPHAGWADGSAWAALDFAPPGEAMGCVISDAWVVAMADGLIVRTGMGEVMQDLDGDGFEQTGWTLLYMHIDTRGRVKPGTYLKAGEHIGHPSCEGGVSNGTHTHVARRYNGEWIPADQGIPFVLDGWVSLGVGKEYDGYLQLGDTRIEAYGGNSPDNHIQR